MKHMGFYSLVRYIRDLERGETINVGTLLEVDGHIYKKFVERLNGEAEIVRRFENTLDGIVEASFEDGEAAQRETILEMLAERRFPHFAISEPRQIVIESQPESLLEDLAQRLVSDPGVPAMSW